MIAIDDQNDWIGSLGGHPQVKTPHLDALADRGTNFTNAHCQAPLCNPSRTSILTGLRPSTTGIYGLAPSYKEVEAFKDRVSLPVALREAGYHTVSTGKIYHLTGKTLPIYQKEFNVLIPLKGGKYRPEKPFVSMMKHPAMDWGVYPENDEEQPDWITATTTIQQMEKAPNDKPWFIACGFVLPHVPCYASQKWFDLYLDATLQMPKIKEDDRNDLPRFADYLAWRLPEPRLSTLRSIHEHRHLVRSYLACVSFMDSQVGRVLKALEASGQLENTIVIVWSDHGWHLGEKGITGKNSLWERSTRVPFIWAGPGITKGQKCAQPAELLDIYPTLMAVLNLTPPQKLEGHSLLPQLKDAETERQAPAITTHNQHNHSVRSKDWRYIRYADGSEELYDHRTDPHEWANLAGNEAYQRVKEEHAKWLPKQNLPPAPGSKDRILTYDPMTQKVVWEDEEIDLKAPMPEGALKQAP